MICAVFVVIAAATVELSLPAWKRMMERKENVPD
jgi:hypothetical protein